MRCYICDKSIEEPQYNALHEDWDPCDTCQNVVNDILSGYKDNPSAEEEDLGTDPAYEGLYPTVTDPRLDDQ